MIDHGYDIGNYTYSNIDYTTTDSATAQEEVGSVYALLEKIIPSEYVSIVALPPYKIDYPMIPYIQNGTYAGHLKQIRANDNNDENFDIQMNFEALQTTQFISDSDPDTITIPKDKKDSLGNTFDKKDKTY